MHTWMNKLTSGGTYKSNRSTTKRICIPTTNSEHFNTSVLCVDCNNGYQKLKKSENINRLLLRQQQKETVAVLWHLK